MRAFLPASRISGWCFESLLSRLAQASRALARYSQASSRASTPWLETLGDDLDQAAFQRPRPRGGDERAPLPAAPIDRFQCLVGLGTNRPSWSFAVRNSG